MRSEFFQNVFGENSEILKKYGRTLKIKKNHVLHSPNEKLEQISIILSGKLKVVKYAPDGNEQVLKYLKENESFGEGLIFSDENYPSYIVAEKDSEVFEISKEGVLKLFKENETFLILYLNEISKKLLNLSNIVDILIIKSIKERLIRYFLLLHKQQKSDIIYFKSKQQIANDIGSVREVVSKKIKELENEGYIKIIDRNHVKLLNIKSLK
ncbi:Crp/Fnr family transcriptional regulator [Marinitoga sp. 1135]|uniref:cAMP-binding protein n=1 Tax=Marinitoga piezophila (strain DSM 14283 / JCM 11233 / KA3) TaxID=443254 RepID=H2J7N6_MARPK|nr:MULTISPECIES: Crp/Fnr family transcriptional regulator [Marinitoga]AEX85377.1 cAMP-binding protein [Marinitoga piezophila KA3]APT75854.1 Crp/Fnr family transcriptional regulator [Marinitoga sp. 1137]NUU95609.1 Crp/Fnr family transcriptional regulator [Marinitoga sp. 1135]NUU97511.1 Crp/Fnr family transcriptional regulator [Marinitoga sp. 1138]